MRSTAVGVGLHREGDQRRRGRAKGVAQHRVVPLQRGGGIDIDRRADRLGDARQRHVLAGELAPRSSKWFIAGWRIRGRDEALVRPGWPGVPGAASPVDRQGARRAGSLERSAVTAAPPGRRWPTAAAAPAVSADAEQRPGAPARPACRRRRAPSGHRTADAQADASVQAHARISFQRLIWARACGLWARFRHSSCGWRPSLRASAPRKRRR